jgi:hypothetical protein
MSEPLSGRRIERGHKCLAGDSATSDAIVHIERPLRELWVSPVYDWKGRQDVLGVVTVDAVDMEKSGIEFRT